MSGSGARLSSRSLLALGVFGMLLAVARGLSTGRLFEVGSNNLVVFLAGLALALLGWAFGRERFARVLSNAIARSASRTPDFLTGISQRPTFYITLGVWFGVTQGLAESAYRAYHDPTPPWRHSFWLAPIAYGVLFGLLGLGSTVIVRRDPAGRARLRLELGLLLTLSGFGFLLLALPQVHAPAALLLAAGLAMQLSRLLVTHAYSVGVVLRWSRWATGAMLLATMIWALGSDAQAARRAQASRAAAPPGAKNVLLIVLDTVRADSLSLLGYQKKTTPILEQWSQQAIVFESAMSTAPWTLPSHAGMFTGRWAHELSAGWVSPLDKTYPTLAEVMRDRGYATAGFVANLSFTTRDTGLSRGFDHYEDFSIGVVEAILSTSLGSVLLTRSSIRNALQYHELPNRKHASRVSADFLEWLADGQDRPFFAFLNYFDAHEPYLPPAPYADRFRSGPSLHRGPFLHDRKHGAAHADWWSLSPEQVASERSLYDAAIASLDREIGQLLDALDRRDVLRNTVVIVTSDHGEHFGEHGLFNHGNNLYLPQLHVPLLILVPERTVSTRVKDSVSLRDLPNTVLELAGLGDTSPFPGSSLVRFWTPGSEPPPAPDLMHITLLPAPWAEAQPTPAARGPIRSIIEDPYQYILNGDGGEELFNYRADPRQARNLADTAGAEELLVRFRAMVDGERP